MSQEEHRADTREEQGGVRREPDQDGDQERGTEHGENVLDAQTDRLGPGEPLIRCHHLRGWDVLTVAVYLPEAKFWGHWDTAFVNDDMINWVTLIVTDATLDTPSVPRTLRVTERDF